MAKSPRGALPPFKTGRFVNVKCTTVLKATLDGLDKRSTLILTTKTGRAFKKRYFASRWEDTCKAAGIADLHFHDIRGTTVTVLFRPDAILGKSSPSPAIHFVGRRRFWTST